MVVSGGSDRNQTRFYDYYRDAPPGVSYGLSFQSVTSMYEDTDGKIWMGTDGGGLNLFDPVKEMFQNILKHRI